MHQVTSTVRRLFFAVNGSGSRVEFVTLSSDASEQCGVMVDGVVLFLGASTAAGVERAIEQFRKLSREGPPGRARTVRRRGPDLQSAATAARRASDPVRPSPAADADPPPTAGTSTRN